MDKIVLDLETKNSFADVGGRNNVEALEISVVGLYSYNRDEYFCVDEHELNKLGDILAKSGLVVGFAIKRFDFPVLQKYLPYDVMRVKHLDILEEIEGNFGRRIGLDVVAQANLGIGKSSHGLEAIAMYKEGRMDDLKKYCLQDVKITKELYDFVCTNGHLMIPDRFGGESQKLIFDWKEEILPQATLF